MNVLLLQLSVKERLLVIATVLDRVDPLQALLFTLGAKLNRTLVTLREAYRETKLKTRDLC